MQLPLSLLVGAAVLFYFGTHLLWHGFGGHRTRSPILRGVLLAMPIVIVAIWLVLDGHPGKGVAILLTGATLLLTLTLGVCAISNPHRDTVHSPSLRMLAPMAAAAFVVGLSGELSVTHAICLTAMAGVLLTTRPPAEASDGGAVNATAGALGTIVLIAGAAAMIYAITKLLQLPVIPLAGPVVVPLVLLASVGLLVGDVHAGTGDRAVDTIVGAVLTLIGFGLPLAIVAAHAMASASGTTQPATSPAIIMPVGSWRIDTVLLTILSVMLLPVGFGRFSLSRLEGFCLVLACVGYMFVTVMTARG